MFIRCTLHLLLVGARRPLCTDTVFVCSANEAHKFAHPVLRSGHLAVASKADSGEPSTHTILGCAAQELYGPNAEFVHFS